MRPYLGVVRGHAQGINPLGVKSMLVNRKSKLCKALQSLKVQQRLGLVTTPVLQHSVQGHPGTQQVLVRTGPPASHKRRDLEGKGGCSKGEGMRKKRESIVYKFVQQLFLARLAPGAIPDS